MSNKETVSQFIEVWRQNPQRLHAELGSLSNETHRLPDSFHFLVSENGLVDPETGVLVKDVIDKQSTLGQTEFKFLETLEYWANENGEGIGLWISVPFPGRYPCSKAIIYQLAYSWDRQKILTNSAILFDTSAKETLSLANKITKKNFDDEEKLRESLIVLEDEQTLVDSLALINQYSQPDEVSTEKINRQISFFVGMISEGTSTEAIYQEMERSGFLGTHAISCPSGSLTFSEFSLKNSEVIGISEGKHVMNCGNCGAPINSVISAGYACHSCGGIYEGC